MPSSIFELTSDLSIQEIAVSKRPVKTVADVAVALTAAEAVNGVVAMTPATGRALTTPTGAELKTFFGGPLEIGTSFELTAVNAAAATHAITFTAGRVTVTNGGSSDWAATDVVTVFASE